MRRLGVDRGCRGWVVVGMRIWHLWAKLFAWVALVLSGLGAVRQMHRPTWVLPALATTRRRPGGRWPTTAAPEVRYEGTNEMRGIDGPWEFDVFEGPQPG